MRSAILIAVICFAGCKHQGAVSPSTQVIRDPVSPKFNLVGTWVAEPDVALPADAGDVVSSRRTKDGVFSVDLGERDGLAIELRTLPLGSHDDYAIADVSVFLNDDPWLRYVGIVKHEEDTLNVWWIESKNLAKLMHADGHSAVIEHSAFGSTVHAEPSDLIESITKHSSELVGKPAVLKRQNK